MRKRTILLTLGVLCLLAALAFTARNLRQEARAQTAAEQTLQTLAPIVQTAADAQTPLICVRNTAPTLQWQFSWT